MVQNADKNPSIKISTIVNKKYLTIRMLGKGGYGVVFEVHTLHSPEIRFAVKCELASMHNNLKSEWELMSLLQTNKARHCIFGVEMGMERNYNFMIMHLVGPTLADLRKATSKRKFTLYTTAVIGVQCFDSLYEIHKIGYIHRDVKPSNFTIGVLGSDNDKLIYVLDFGLCRNIYNAAKQLRKPRAKVPFRGTVQYASLNIHQRLEPGRHDDFWSLLFMLIEFHTGDLPWESSSKEEAKRSKENKLEDLLEKCPKEFRLLRMHLLTLTYTREPNYSKIRSLLWQLIHINKFTLDTPLDWQKGGEEASVFAARLRLYNMKRENKKAKDTKLADIIEAPKDFVVLEEKDFSQADLDPPRDASTSRSDDTIQVIHSAKKPVLKAPQSAPPQPPQPPQPTPLLQTPPPPSLVKQADPAKKNGFVGKMKGLFSKAKRRKN